MGLKAGFLEHLYSQSREAGRDVLGKQFMSGHALRDALQKSRSSANRLFSTDELKRMDTVVTDLIAIENRRLAKVSKEGVIGDKSGRILEVLAGVSGARVGSFISRKLGGGGAIQIPAIFSREFRAMQAAGVKDPAARLIRDMIFDEDLFKELLQKGLDKEGATLTKPARRRLNSWAAAVIAEYGGAFEEEDMQSKYFNVEESP